MQLVQQSSTTHTLPFFMVSSSDHISGATGLTVTVVLRKPGGSFGAAAGAVSEVGDGWYEVAGNATDNNTLGPLLLHATASGADPTDTAYQVVGYNPDVAPATESALATAQASITDLGSPMQAGSTPAVNVAQVNSVDVTGSGTSGDPWGPA